MKRAVSVWVVGVALAVWSGGVAAANGDDRIVLRPGDGLAFSEVPTPGWCSVAAIGHDAHGRLVAITAGHCRQTGTAPIWKVDEQHRGPIGAETDVVSTGSVDALGFPTDEVPDYAVILLDEERVRGSNTSLPNDRGERVVLTSIGSLDEGDQPVGAHCSAGRSNGVACTTGDVLVDSNLMSSRLLMKPGDSGGSLVRAGTGEWIGVSIGYRLTDTRPAAYQRADRIMEEIDAKGDVGAGFSLVTEP